jgi:hypothetical protein
MPEGHLFSNSEGKDGRGQIIAVKLSGVLYAFMSNRLANPMFYIYG